MNIDRLKELFSRYADLRIVVFGDFFLDKYLEIDPKLNEISIETGLTAYQVTGKRLQAGAAGTVCNNLAALGVGHIEAVGIIGDDGEGYDLCHALKKINADHSKLIISDARFTPTYTKPMLQHASSEEELERQDIKNRKPLPLDLEDILLQQLRESIANADAVIVADQVQERNCGSITGNARKALHELGDRYPGKLIFCDSRERIDEFTNVTVKPNRFEAYHAAHGTNEESVSTDAALEAAKQMRDKNGHPVILTLDKEGICPVCDENCPIVPCPPVTGPIDIVGAGDSVTAGIVSSLAAGASYLEAAIMGNLVASITIRQLGTTGTASQEQVLEAWQANESLYAPLFTHNNENL